MLVLVTGATGAIGPRVVRALDHARFRIRTFSSDTPVAGMFSPNVEVLTGDVKDEVDVASAMEGVDAVIHMAALLHIVNPQPEMYEKYERVNVGGTATVVEAARKEGVKHVVLFSTIAVYGSSNGYVLDEMSPTHPDTMYTKTKLAAERIVLNARGADGQPLGTVLRLGAVYGSRIKGNYYRLVQSLARSRFIPIGNGANRRTLVYDKDVAHAAVMALKHPAAAGKIFNVSDGEIHTLNNIIIAICAALDRKPPRFSLPISPVRFAVGIVEDTMQRVGINPPIMRATIDKYIEDVAVDSKLIQRELGFAPKYDLLRGWKDAVHEMRRLGDL